MQQAVLLTAPGASSHGSNLAKLLNFFGVPWQNSTADEFFAQIYKGDENSTKFRLLSSAGAFLEVIDRLKGNPESVRLWSRRVHSAFVYAGDSPEILQKLARKLTGDNATVIREINSTAEDLRVTDQWNDFCAVMAGVRVTASAADVQASLILNRSNRNGRNIIAADEGATFLTVEYENVAVFLSSSKSVIDIDSKLTSENFDIREHFLTAVPVVLYIKWAFAGVCWNSPEANASLVIDDPLLKPDYGCVNFKELLALMERYHFATNIAFIPWNWRRSNPDVARLFRQRPEHYSLSIHGSDHVAAEFGSRNRGRLYWKTKRAVDRMSDHETSTGISHEKVMVFPQGIFSEAAMDVLKRSNFTAAVNTDVLSVDPRSPAIRISDVWDVALMRYGSFPIFTRRSPEQKIANFAFDILLGKPCIIGSHHDFCRDRYKHLLDLVNGLNALARPLSWRSLGEVVRRSFRQRESSLGVLEIEMYATELRLENYSRQRQRYLIRRREPEPLDIKDVRADFRELTWSFSDGWVRFELELEGGQQATIRIQFRDMIAGSDGKENFSYRVKARLRRYLSEVRDNYIVKTKLRLSRLFE
ncbi:MAG TPA: hypothetical protein VK639_17880 [Terriglobales bacterium]|nr:hypothetical protein [Terriglobales bacterium]